MTQLFRYERGDSLDFSLKNSRTVCTIGSFDGIHLGHRELLGNVVRKAKEMQCSSVLLSFWPHPRDVLRGHPPRELLTPLRKKIDLLDEIGIDLLYLIRFTKKFSQILATDFLENVLIGHLDVQHMVLGPDTAFGKGREGDIAFIQQQLERHGRSAEVMPVLEDGGEKISSERLRQSLERGDVRTLTELLGRQFSVLRRVVSGEKRGRTIGIPTLNQHCFGQALPKRGVYGTRTLLDGKAYPSVTNIGYRPTVKGETLSLETHVPGQDLGDRYGQYVELVFLDRIRDEQKFDSLEDLRHQIATDIEQAIKIHEQQS